MIILNTRPAAHGAAFVREFSHLGAPIVHSPVLTAHILPAWPTTVDDYDAVIFTSPMAPALRPADPGWRDLPVFAVGEATAAAARAAGFGDVRCTGHTAVDLCAVLSTQTFRRALHPSGADITRDVAAAFPGRVERVAVYRMIAATALSPEAAALLRTPTELIVPLFSRRSAAAFAALARSVAARRAALTAVGISAHALDIASPPWHGAIAVPVPTAPAMAAAVADHLNPRRAAA
ncbi:MAG: uroporphyrinogen-III synthase [Rhodospirillaceae bacterium]|nr:uroporphyrinogen-III synthase [Rhodospirillaceae bacterium]